MLCWWEILLTVLSLNLYWYMVAWTHHICTASLLTLRAEMTCSSDLDDRLCHRTMKSCPLPRDDVTSNGWTAGAGILRYPGRELPPV